MYPNFCIIDPCLMSASDYLILKSLSTATSLNVSLLHPGYRSWFSFFLDLRFSICFRLCSCRQDLNRPPPSLHEVSFIEEIVSHVGNKQKPSTMKFYFKWLNYDSNHNSWEPWKSMRATDQLHTYLRKNNMLHVIPKEFRNVTPNTREEPWITSFEDYF